MGSAGLRVGVAGAGHFGRHHALKVAASERALLAGIYDPDEERAEDGRVGGGRAVARL